jgi:antitoxin component HigA of HigAB toxin-antitoxin module/mRNA-degrading endonuclease HigB of HigAB toxin-antitoxin module
MHIISERALEEFAAQHPESRVVLVTWKKIVKAAHWQTPHDVQATLPATDILPGGVVVFDVGGNNYRISANIRYVNELSRVGRVYIRHVMTHAEYTAGPATGRSDPFQEPPAPPGMARRGRRTAAARRSMARGRREKHTKRTEPVTPMAALLDFSTPHLLRNAAEYEAAHAEVLALLDANPKPDTAEHDRLEFLTVLIEAYDREHVRFGEDDEVTPQDIVMFVLEQHGKTRQDLEKLLGGKSRVSEFFSGKRPLSMGQVKALRDTFHIPADLLIPRGADASA